MFVVATHPTDSLQRSEMFPVAIGDALFSTPIKAQRDGILYRLLFRNANPAGIW